MEHQSHPPNFPKVLYSFPQCAGAKFMPPNGTEGMIFTAAFCERCIHEKYMQTMDTNDLKCEILTKALMCGDVDEWVHSSEGWPICTAWKKWDWGGGDGDGLNEPPDPEPEDPNQLLLPFDITDLFSFADPEILVTRRAIFERELIDGRAPTRSPRRSIVTA
jgi:hypothetical protein